MFLWLVCAEKLHEMCYMVDFCFFFQAEDGIRDLVRSRGLGDVYKRQAINSSLFLNKYIGGYNCLH